jgi:hypothetical protein
MLKGLLSISNTLYIYCISCRVPTLLLCFFSEVAIFEQKYIFPFCASAPII